MDRILTQVIEIVLEFIRGDTPSPGGDWQG